MTYRSNVVREYWNSEADHADHKRRILDRMESFFNEIGTVLEQNAGYDCSDAIKSIIRQALRCTAATDHSLEMDWEDAVHAGADEYYRINPELFCSGT